MKLRKIVVWTVILVFISPILAFAAGNYLPQFDGFTVTGGSMEPEIKTGSVLFTQNVPAEEVNVGDTITFRDGDHFTTHKVIDKNTSNEKIVFRTQGVANQSPDPGTVTEDELQGRKLFSIPFLGYFIAWVSTPLGLLTTIILPGGLLILLEARDIYIELSSEVE